MRTLLIGEAPARGGDPRRPLTGRIGRRLASLAGLEHPAYLRAFRRRNLLGRWPGRQGEKGAAFPMAEARAAAERTLLRGRVVFLGRRVAGAFGLPADAPFMRWCCLGGVEVAVLPHPSGVVRWWNDRANVAAASAFLRRCAA